jgi:D-sedoheptulose 7-phosphate isomerase
MQELISDYIKTSSTVIESLNGLSDKIAGAAVLMVEAAKQGKKIIIFGNGGSAADSQHIATELVSRFRKERKAIPAIALTTNTSSLTAIGNDYDFDSVFSRQLEALAVENDVAIAISTSGNSSNVIKGARLAQEKKVKVVALTGESGGKLAEHADVLINIPSKVTSHIQEGHLAVYHMLCCLVEESLF